MPVSNKNISVKGVEFSEHHSSFRNSVLRGEMNYSNEEFTTDHSVTFNNNLTYNSRYINSRNCINTNGYQVGYSVDKDMTNGSIPSLPTAYAPGPAINLGSASASYWDDWGDDIYDSWGYFYLYDPATHTYRFLQLSPQNQDDGVISTQIVSAFGRTFTIKHGYPVQGIFKFDISVNDNGTFVFGAYGDMGSDEDTINTNLTKPYTLGNNNLLLYYNRNVQSGSLTERLYSFFIPYDIEENGAKPYNEHIFNEAMLSIYSNAVRKGLTIYFAKKEDVSDWVMSDLHLSVSNIVNTPSQFNSTVVVNSALCPRIILTELLNQDTTVLPSQIINGYFTTVNLSVPHTLVMPSSAAIVNAIDNCQVGSSFRFTINNCQDNDCTRTLIGGYGVIALNCPNLSVDRNVIITYLGIVTNTTPGQEIVRVVQENSYNIIFG